MDKFNIGEILANTAYLAIIIGYAYIAKLVHDRVTSFDDDHEIEIQNNAAVGIRRGGVYLGIFLGILGPISGPSHGFANDLWSVIAEGAIVTVLLLFAALVSEHGILPKINNDLAVQNKNIAVALLEAGSFIATGLIAWGSFSGDGSTFGKGLVEAVTYQVLGQGVLILAVRTFSKLLRFDVDKELEGNNVACGLFVSSVIVAVGIVLRAAITGPSESLMTGITSFGFSAIAGIVLVYAAQWVADTIFLRNSTLSEEICRDQNIAAVAVSAALMIGAAFAVSVAVI